MYSQHATESHLIILPPSGCYLPGLSAGSTGVRVRMHIRYRLMVVSVTLVKSTIGDTIKVYIYYNGYSI